MRLAFALLLALPLTVACAKKPAAAEPAVTEARPISQTTISPDGLVRKEVDLDADGRVDVINLYRERPDGGQVMVEKQVDLNLDGDMDVISEFDEAGALLTERMDRDFDGVFDWIDHYKGGVRVMAEMDNTYDGRTDTWFYYTVNAAGQPHIDRKERDTTGDGRIDFWERFDEQGNVVRSGRDLDGDGKMDERDQ
jgi:hypothetical protein